MKLLVSLVLFISAVSATATNLQCVFEKDESPVEVTFSLEDSEAQVFVPNSDFSDYGEIEDVLSQGVTIPKGYPVIMVNVMNGGGLGISVAVLKNDFSTQGDNEFNLNFLAMSYGSDDTFLKLFDANWMMYCAKM